MRWTAHIILKQHHINTKYQHVMLKYHHILKVIHIRQLMPSIRKHLTAHIVWYDTTSYLWYYTFPLYYTPSTTLTPYYNPSATSLIIQSLQYAPSTTFCLLHPLFYTVEKRNLPNTVDNVFFSFFTFKLTIISYFLKIIWNNKWLIYFLIRYMIHCQLCFQCNNIVVKWGTLFYK